MKNKPSVRIATTKQGWEMIQNVYPKHLKKRGNALYIEDFKPNLLDWINYFYSDETGVYLGWEGEALYDDYFEWFDVESSPEYFPEIFALFDTINELKENEIPFQYVRIGGNVDDFEIIDHLNGTDILPFYISSEIKGGKPIISKRAYDKLSGRYQLRRYADSTLKAMSKAQLIDYIRIVENTFQYCDRVLSYSDALVHELIKQCPNFDFDTFQQKYDQLDKNQKGED